MELDLELLKFIGTDLLKVLCKDHITRPFQLMVIYVVNVTMSNTFKSLMVSFRLVLAKNNYNNLLIL